MLEKILTVLFNLLLAVVLCTAQPRVFIGYSDPGNAFTCDNFRREIITLDQECGTILSPCYPMNYPNEVGNTFKIWQLNASFSRPSLPVEAYMFTINVFDTISPETGLVSAFLDFAEEITSSIDGNITVYMIDPPQRNLTLSGNGEIGISLDFLFANGERTQEMRLIGESFIVNSPSLFLNFYSNREESAMGFNITYCADYDRCDPNYTPAVCTVNRGTCVRNGFNNYSCNCIPGFTGDTCETDIIECDETPGPCDGNATCTNTVGSFDCDCNSGFSGDGFTCMDIDECASSPCDGNATCTDGVNMFTCTCNRFYTGNGMQCVDLNECEDTTLNSCSQNANCINLDGAGFNCICRSGFSGDGFDCTNINECLSNPCAANATCTDTSGSFTCECEAGFTGDGNTMCVDINECASSPCDENAACTDGVNMFTCTCNQFYTGNGLQCVDLDECVENLDNCADNLATCTNLVGSGFECTCNVGFTGDGVVCTNINECLSGPCDPNAACVDTEGSFTCTCNQFFTGNGLVCSDLFECENDLDNCSGNATCNNIVGGSFDCTCFSGFSGDGVQCTDIDECDILSPCVPEREICINQPGSFQCVCNNPTYRNVSGMCLGPFCIGFNNGTFNNCTEPGVFGWPNDYDGVTFYENGDTVRWNIDLTGNSSFPAIRFTFIALDVEPLQDYIIFNDNTDPNLEDAFAIFTGSLDEIFNGNVSASMTNPVGFTSDPARPVYIFNGSAQVFVIFQIDRRINMHTGFVIQFEQDEDECLSNPCVNGECMDIAFDYECINCGGYTGRNCSVDIDECLLGTDNCSDNATCTNNNGSFTCMCNDDFTGDGVICLADIVLSGLQGTSSSDPTQSFLTVNFDITDRWERDRNYIINYIIDIQNLDTGGGRQISTPDVDSDPFLPFTFPVMAAQNYMITILPGQTGPEFVNANFSYANDRRSFNITSNSIAPRVPVDLTVENANIVFVSLNWTNPDETDRGATTQFEISYERTDCVELSALGIDDTHCTEQTIRFPASFMRPFAIGGIVPYRNYTFRVRAYTSQGPGDYTQFTTSVYTGSMCSSDQTREEALQNPCTLPFGSLQSSNFPIGQYPSIAFQYWQFNYTSFGANAIRFGVDYFQTQVNQDFVDLSRGEIRATRPALVADENPSVIISLNGTIEPTNNIANFMDDNTNEDGLAYAIFTSDRFINRNGFLLFYETNSEFCSLNQCQNGGTCNAIPFDFECQCTEVWGGELCNRPLIVIQATCTPLSSSSVSVTWNATQPWSSDTTLINGFDVSYNGPSNNMQISGFSTEINNLSPFQRLEITVRANVINPIVEEISDMETCFTNQAPSEAPGNVAATAVSNTGIDVTWDTPTVPNGVITGYRVTYVRTDFDTFNETPEPDRVQNTGLVNELSITGLDVFRNYRFTVVAINGAGDGASGMAMARTMPGAPVGPVQNVEVEVTSRSAILTITQPAVITGDFTYDVEYASNSITDQASPITIENLLPATSYTFVVFPRTAAGRGSVSVSETITTDEEVPGPVGNVTVNPVSATSISVVWGEPPMPNGVIRSYRLMWVPVGGENPETRLLEDNIFFFDITGLQAFTNYSVSLSAATMVGNGEETTVVVRTFVGVPVGPVLNVEAEATATTVTLTFSPPAVVTGEFSYEVGYSTLSITRPASPITIENLLPATNYTFTIIPLTTAGRGSESAVVMVRTLDALPGPVDNFIVEPISSTEINVTWNEPQMPNGDITGYSLSWVQVSGGAETSQSLSGDVNSFTIENLQVFTDYRVTINAATTGGNGADSVDTARTLAGAPVGPVQNVTFERTATSITLTVDQPAVVTGIFTYDIVYTAEGSTQQQMAVNEQSPYTITGLRPGTTYTIMVFPRSNNMRGAENFTLIVTTDGGEIGPVTQLSSGTITSNSVELTWTEPTNLTTPVNEYVVTWVSADSGGMIRTNMTTVTVTGLNPFTVYNFTVSALNGEEERLLNIITNEAAPTMVRNLILTNEGNSIGVTFEMPAMPNGILLDYTIRIAINVTNCIQFGDTTCDSVNPILWTIQAGQPLSYTTTDALRPFRYYDVSVTARTNAGTSEPVTEQIRTNPGAVAESVDNIQVTADGTNATITWTAPQPINGPTTYVVTATPLGTGIPVTETILGSTSQNLSVTLVNLDPEQGYSITVGASIEAGDELASDQVELPRSPQVITGVTPTVPANQDLQGGSPTSTINVPNPCALMNTFFNSTRGRTTMVDIVVREIDGIVPTSLGFWANSIQVTPIPAYVTARINCPDVNKRSLTPNGEAFTVGLDTACSLEDTSTRCNGPLLPDRTYQVAYRGINSAGSSELTNFGADTRTQADTGLQPGEIAAIVICSVLLLIIIIVVIVYLIHRRRKTRTLRISKKKNDDIYSQVSGKKSTTPRFSSEASSQLQTTYSEFEEKKTKM